MFKLNHKSSLLGAGVGLIILSGCKVDVTADIYSRDVFASENLTFPAQLSVEVPTCKKEKIDELSGEVLAVFSRPSEASVVGCERDGMDSMLTVNFTGEMVDSESEYDLTIFRTKEPKFAYLTAAFNSNFQKRVQQLMSSRMMSMDYDDLTISFTLNNDLPGELEYSLVSGWVDGKPGQRIRGTLDRREKVHVVRTKVVSQMVMENMQPELITLQK